MQDDAPTDPLVIVQTFLNDAEAEIALSALEAAGIDAMLRRDDGGALPSLWVDGIALLVRPEDQAAAAEVLRLPITPIDPDAE